MSEAIKEAISDDKKVINNSLEKLKAIISAYACQTPEKVREGYDRIFGIIEKKRTEINEKKVYIDESINDLIECKNILLEMEEVINQIGITSNEGRMGTLHGLCRELINKEQIPLDEIGETVIDFPYDEKKEIEKSKKEDVNSIGGKKINTKRKNI